MLVCAQLSSCSFIIIGGAGKDAVSTDLQTEAESTVQDSPLTPDRLGSARAEAQKALGAVAEGDYDGMMFLFVCSDMDAAFGDPDSEEVLPREKYARIKALNSRLNTDIILSEVSYDEMATGLMTNENSGMVFAHMLEVEVFRVGALAGAGLVGNMNALPFIDFTKPYYDQDYIEEMNTPAGLFSLYGDACIDANKPKAIYYNERIAADSEIGALESAVREGEWDLDKLAECIKAANDSSDLGSHVGAVITDTAEFLRSAYIASGLKSTVYEDDALTLFDNSAKTDSLMAKLREILPMCTLDPDDEAPAESTFKDGGALFYVGSLAGVRAFYHMKDTWGVLPMPTAEGGSDYRTAMHPYTQVLCYPSSGVKAKETYVMIDSFFACSYKILDAAMKDDYLHCYSRNIKASEMLGYVTMGIRFDLLDAYGDVCPKARAAVFGALEQSYWDKVTYSEIFAKLRAEGNADLALVKKP